VLVSDTVGFIKNLPHGLVASFKSTLDEALDASLLLHVVDASDPGFERQLEVTEDVLKEINADVIPRILVFNKIDHVGDAAAQAECEATLRLKYPNCIVMSARRPDEVAKLHQKIVEFFQQDLVEIEIFLPWATQQLRGEIYAKCQVLNERSNDEGTFLMVRTEPDIVKSLLAQLGVVPSELDED
jgi:GTP-binding protein HflX